MKVKRWQSFSGSRLEQTAILFFVQHETRCLKIIIDCYNFAAAEIIK